MEEEMRNKAIVQMAIGTIFLFWIRSCHSYLQWTELLEKGLIVASKVTDRAGITRSVIVNALRKIWKCRCHWISFSMKGTHIKVIPNDKLLDELKNMVLIS